MGIHEEDFTISKEIACYFYQSLHNLNDTENISLNLKYEAAIYQCVRAGNLTKLKERLNSSSGQFYYSYFCDIPHKKAQCHYIANVALISHYAIAGGLTTSIAYALCETYVHAQRFQQFFNTVSQTDRLCRQRQKRRTDYQQYKPDAHDFDTDFTNEH